MNKYTSILFSIFFCSILNSSYMNNEVISFRSILTGDCYNSLDYNILNNGDGSIGGKIRAYGIHNMSVAIEGYEAIDLIKDDICLYPNLFTILGSILWDSNMFVQRWSCVKWWMPLYFGFKIKGDQLTIVSTLSNYRFLSPCRASRVINLTRINDFNPNIADENRNIVVYVNGRGVVFKSRTYLSVYSTSSLHPYAVLLRQFFL